MSENESKDREERLAEELGHEPFTISSSAVTKGFVALFAVILASLVLMALLVRSLSVIEGGPPRVNAPPEPHSTPDAPVLDADQRGHLADLRRRERAVLTEYAWIDEQNGIARIPIRRAIEIMSTREAGAAPSQQP